MADLTADAPVRFMGEAKSEKWVLDNSVAQTIYKGQPMILDVSVDTVYLRGYVDATVVAADDIFVGFAAEGKTVLTTDNEVDNEIEVYTWPTILGLKSSVYTDADVGDTVYMSDSGTLSATAADNPQVGKLHRVLNGYAFIQEITPQICSGA